MKPPYLISHFRLTMLAALTFLLVACGDDENTQADNSNTTPPTPTAVISTENSELILSSALESIQALAGANEASDYIASLVDQMTQGNLTNISPPPGFEVCDSSVIPTPTVGSGGGTIDFNNLCILTPDGVKITLDGRVSFSTNNQESVSVSTENLAISTANNETFHLTLKIDVSQDNINLSMTLINPLGVEISTVNLEVSGGMYSGINSASGSIMVANFGSVLVHMSESEPLTFSCTGNNVPSSGTIDVDGADDSSASITFINCDSYKMAVNGVEGAPVTWSGTIPAM